MKQSISEQAKTRRAYWVRKIQKLSGNFGQDSDRLEVELNDEIKANGLQSLIDHLRLCGAIPESYGHDSSEEKLYSKYTDALLALAFQYIGINSCVLKERADSADVECVAEKFSFVADAKSFRLSRTAKNQKDFKVQAMDNWKRGKPYAVVVCPIYQLPSRSSQIYQQAASRNVCIFTYSHLSVLASVSDLRKNSSAQSLLLKIMKSVSALNPSKDAIAYWTTINRTMIHYSPEVEELWKIEKKASVESINYAKEEALNYFAHQREKIMTMPHDEAIRELIRVHKIDNRVSVIKSVVDNGLLSIM